MANFYGPDPLQSTFFIPGSNTPGNGVQLFIYLAGSTTKTTVYKTQAGTAHTNPIILDSGGNLPSQSAIWIPSGVTIKAVYAPSNDSDPPASPYLTIDNLSGMNDISATASEWVTGPAPTFVSVTSFTVVGDQTTTFTVGRRIQTTNTGGTIYSVVASVSFGGGLTTVNVVNDSGVLDSGLSAVMYSLLNPAFPSINAYYVDRKGAAIASAATTNIWQNGNFAHITGTNTIRSFSSAPYPGAAIDLIFDSSLVLSSTASLNFQTITTQVNDRIRVRAETVSTAILQYYESSTFPLGAQVSNTIFAGPSTGPNALPTFRPLSAFESAMTLLASVINVNNTSFVSFNSTAVDYTAFDEYKLHITKLQPTSNAVIVFCRFSTNNGASFDSGNNYQSAILAFSSANTSASNGTTTISGMRITESIFGIGAFPGGTVGYDGDIVITTPSLSATIKKIKVDSNYFDSTSQLMNVNGSGSYTAGLAATTGTAPINAIQIIPASGNISTGSFYMYGIRKV